MKTKIKPTHGRLVFIENKSKRKVVVKTGQFALLNFHKSAVQSEPQYANGVLKITH
ncbi:MAG: hypothetical protein PF694_09100 [Bacteroidetes bacterium]|jgi:hypothetical protein|nr:hypothetical protein [Bacteroidota bacterium]